MQQTAIDIDGLVTPIRASARPDEFICKNGVVLKLKKIKGSLVRDMFLKVEKPRVPKIYIAEKSRSEDNPNDPDYQLSISVYNAEISAIAIAASLVFGTELKSKPEDVPAPDDDWAQEYIDFGLDVRAKGTKNRYFDWLKYVVTEDDEELGECVNAVKRFSGMITEEEAASAESTFPRR